MTKCKCKYCCEQWAHSKSAHTTSRSTRRPTTEPIQPLAMGAEAWKGIPRVSDWVWGIIKWGYTFQFARSPPAIQQCGSHLALEQRRTRPALQGDEFTGERSHRNGSASSKWVRLLQPLLPRPQERWRPPAHPRSQAPEAHPHEMAIQDDYIETDPLTSVPRGLVLFSGPGRCLLSHPESPPSQTILEIRLWGSGISIYVPSLRTVPGCLYFYKVHGCCSFPSETDGIRVLNYLDNWLVLAQSEDKLPLFYKLPTCLWEWFAEGRWSRQSKEEGWYLCEAFA